MKKLKQDLGKRVFEKGTSPVFCRATLGKILDVFVGCFFTAGAHSPRPRPGRLGRHMVIPAAPRARRISARPETTSQIGRLPSRALSPRRWAMPFGMSPQSGRSMVEMLAVLAIIGVLSVAALAGLTYAMNKHRANTIYNDVHLLALHVMDTGKDTVPADFYPDSGRTYSLDTTTYADGFVVKVSDVSEKVCDRIMEVNDPSIEKIYVGSEETTTCSGTQMMGFMFLYDGKLTSGGSSGGSGSGSGTDPDPVDPCEGIVCQHGGTCVDGFCRCADGYSGNYCEVEPDLCAGVTCSGHGTCTDGACICDSGYYPEDVNCLACPTVADIPAKECTLTVHTACDAGGQISKPEGALCSIASDTSARFCHHTLSETVVCELEPCPPINNCQTYDGVCACIACQAGTTYDETAEKCCEDLTETTCQKLVPASSGVCPTLEHVSTEGFPCTTTDNADGTCQSGTCVKTVIASCDGGTAITGNNGHEYCMSNEAMSWSDANTWCEEQGRRLASIDEACPGWDQFGYTSGPLCGNFSCGSSVGGWVTPSASSDCEYVVEFSFNICYDDYTPGEQKGIISCSWPAMTFNAICY